MSDKERAYSKALKYLGYKMRTEYELREYLKKINCNKDDFDFIIYKLIEYKLINDEQYAEYWIRDRFAFFSHGRYKLMSDLLKKGIRKSIIEEKINEFFDGDKEENKIRDLLLKKNPNKNYLSEKECISIYKYIIRKGFPANKVRKIIFENIDFSDS